MADNLRNLESFMKGLKKFFGSLVMKITGRVEVSNLPEVQEVFVNNQAPHIEFDYSHFSELQKGLEASLMEVIKGLKSVEATASGNKPEKAKADLIKALTAIRKELSVKPEDKTHLVTNKIDQLIKAIPTIEKVNFEPILEELRAVQDGIKFFENFTKYDEVKTRMNEKQFEDLVKAVKAGAATAVGGGGQGNTTAADVVTVDNVNPNGLTTAANSQPVVEASDSAVNTSLATIAGDTTSLDGKDFATSAKQQTDALTDTELRASDVAVTLDGEEVTTNADSSDIDANNSTTTPLGISGVFTGTGVDLDGYSSVAITLHADVDSATDGMDFQFSTDNTNWDDLYKFTMDVSSSNTRRFQFPVCARYFRVVYTNGTSAQSTFRVQTVLHRTNILTSIHRFGDTITADRSAQVVKSGLVGQDAIAGDFKAVKTYDAAGSFTGLLVIPVDTNANPWEILTTQQDNLANTSNGLVGTSLLYGFDGSTWDRLRGDSTNGLLVNLGSNNDVDINDISKGTQTNDVKITLDSEVVAASQSGTWNINDISGIVSLPTGAATAAKQLPDGHNVTVDNAAGASAVNVQDGGNSLTVDATNLDIRDLTDASDSVKIGDGTETANVNASNELQVRDDDANTDLDTIAGAVAGTEMQVDVVASLPAGTNNIGDVDVLTQPARDRTTDNQGVALQTDAIMNDTTALTPKYAVIDDATSGNNTIVAAVAGKKIRVLQWALVCAGAVTVRWEDGASGTALTGQMQFAANSGMNSGFCPVGHFETTANTLLNLELSAATSVDGWLVYVEI